MEKYPIGLQNFKSIREGGYVYVDKTHFIPPLVEEGKYYFLSRPRRFGKSLFLSTLKCFFEGEKALFKNLAVESYDWNWETYPVVHIDFTGMNYDSEDALSKKLDNVLGHYEQTYGVTSNWSTPDLRFHNLLTRMSEITGKQVVVLIDEYEKPVVDNFSNPKLSDYNKSILRGVYGVLKAFDAHLKFVLLTGVTKFGKMSIFSDLNNLNDISMDVKYGALCGITEEELLANFPEGIGRLAQEEGVSFEEGLKLLKLNYDGYHFSRNCPDLYNPFSVVNALSKGEIESYWFATGTPSLLVDLLLQKNYKLEDIDGTAATKERLLDIGNQFDDPISLLYQTGYLTIKSYNKPLKIYTVGFPNREVEVAFFNFIMPYYLKFRTEKPETFILDFAEGINNGDPEKAMTALEAFSGTVNYDLVHSPEIERHFQLMVYIFSRVLLPYATSVKCEERTSDGRIDLLIQTPRYIYIIEIKRDKSAQEALQQIKTREYDSPYKTDRRTKFLIGVNFSTEKRRIDDFAIVQEGRL